MVINFDKNVIKFQEGGAVPAQGPEQTPQQDPMAELLMVAGEAVQTGNCEAALAVCAALVELAQPAPQQQAPVGEPVFQKGGKIVKRV